jgi:hypothetical protein
VIYLSGTLHRDLYGVPGLGMMLSPASSKPVPAGMVWAADNGAFLGKYPGDAAFLAWLDTMPRAGCLFAVAPDVVGDAAATWERSAPLLPHLRARGYRACLAAQNGWRAAAVDWRLVDAILLGGDDAFKLGAEGRQAAWDARAHGRHLHVGRVNSLRRLHWAAGIGAHSADGTSIRFNPGRYIPEMRRWIATVNAPRLLDVAAVMGGSA